MIKKFKRRKVYTRFKDIWAADLAEMGSLFSFDHGVKYLLCHRCLHQICLGQNSEGKEG